MNILFYDTETTGKFERDYPLTHPSQPHIVQFAGLLTDEDGNEIMDFKTLVRPTDDWNMHPKALETHGITIEQCQKFGIPIATVLHVIYVTPADLAVAHNNEFDESVVRVECKRNNRDQVLSHIPERFDTMKASTDLCKIPNEHYPGFKWPKLEEAYEILLGKKIENAHDAMADVRACKDIFFYIKRLNQKPDDDIPFT